MKWVVVWEGFLFIMFGLGFLGVLLMYLFELFLGLFMLFIIFIVYVGWDVVVVERVVWVGF